ncbi:MAG: asparagine synthase (glutamine-hydrolyzing) [Candidatus Sulfotelmatobacter sp.]
MCGIFGIIAQDGRIPAGMLERGTESLAHRGPDDSGTVVLQDSVPGPVEIGLGNRRLAILDLSPLPHQPMHDAETGNWIVYNGEIYNFRDVRRELELAGTSFVSHSDTEVLLKAYACWGQQCLAKLRGMFAFAIWDARQHRLFLARDPMGIKPLYYFQSGSYFLFASEVRTLLGTGLVPRQIDHAGLINYLTFGSAYDPLTLVKDVYALPAGCTLTWESGTLRQSTYWDLVDEGPDGQTREAVSAHGEMRAVEHLQSILEEAVRLQLVSDVPVGVFLSGGIDSSALVSILSRGGVTPSTFSIVFREAEFSEAQHSRAVATKFHTDHHEISVSQADVLAAIPDALCAMDLPTMDGINTYFVSREARRAGVKVALSGLGGDEIFAGYSSFRTVPRMERFAQFWNHAPYAVRAPLASALAALSPENDQSRKLISLARDNGEILHPYFLARMLFTPDQRSVLLPESGADTTEAAKSQRLCLQRALPLDAVNRVSYLEARCYMLNTLLRDADFMSMSQGLEVRVPLIDHRLAKAVLALPGAWKLSQTSKKLLVGAMAGSLPDEIVHRPKRGFTLPFEHWMRQELRAEIEPGLDAKRINGGPLGGLLNGAEVQAVWQRFLCGKTSWSRPWSLYVLQRWCELHL